MSIAPADFQRIGGVHAGLGDVCWLERVHVSLVARYGRDGTEIRDRERENTKKLKIILLASLAAFFHLVRGRGARIDAFVNRHHRLDHVWQRSIRAYLFTGIQNVSIQNGMSINNLAFKRNVKPRLCLNCLAPPVLFVAYPVHTFP